MKKTFCFLILFFALTLSVHAEAQVGAEAVSEAVRRSAPTEFEYVDNTEYAMQHDFAELSFVDDSCIVVCAESTNFSEFGVFHLANEKDVGRCERLLRSYLSTRKSQFQNGVIYDVGEYPKFENARVFSVGRFVIYTILDAKDASAAEKAVRDLLK